MWSGMSRTQFCEYFEIPYRTVQNWELGLRKCPDYIIELMIYRLKRESYEDWVKNEEQKIKVHKRNEELNELFRKGEFIRKERMEILKKRSYLSEHEK